MSKLVLIRLALSGALVAIAIVELVGLSSSVSQQVVAGGVGAATVAGLKLAHFI